MVISFASSLSAIINRNELQFKKWAVNLGISREILKYFFSKWKEYVTLKYL